MSNKETNATAVSAKTQPQAANKKTKKHKKKIWKQSPKEPLSKGKMHGPGKLQTVSCPPKDAQQFSANWKLLLEVLKPNPLSAKSQSQSDSKKTPQVKTIHDSAKKDKTDKKQAKDFPKNNSKPLPQRNEKSGKEKTLPSSSQNGPGKGLSSSETQKPKAKKRKPDQTKVVSSSEQVNKAKRKKPEDVTKKTPTEADLWFDDVDPDDIEATVGAEAAEVMRKKQGTKKADPQDTEKALVKERAFEGITKAVAIDCEMVGVGPDGEESIVARVSLVNLFGKCIYDKFVKPTEKVTDYRTQFSGIRPDDIKNGENVKTVQKEVSDIIKGRILVGHAIHNDLKILLLDHPKKNIRDTQKYKPFRKIAKSGRPALRVLCREVLHVKVQQGEHSSVQDAQATMRLYTMVKKEWEAEIKANRKNPGLNKKSPRKPKAPQTT